MKFFIYFLIVFLYIVPSIIATTTVLLRTKENMEKEEITFKNILQNIKENGLSVADIVLYIVLFTSILILLAASWVPVLNYLIIFVFLSGDDIVSVLARLDKIQIIKPRINQEDK